MQNREDFLQLFDGSLPVEQITNSWYNKYKNSNFGAIITFVGVVRDENKIDGLSFDIYEPILNSWLDSWQKKANEKDAIVRATVVSDSDDEDTQVLKKEIDENWDSIKAFYTGKGGKDDPNAIYEDILDAHAAWKRRYGSAKDTGTKTAAELAASRGVIGSSPKNKSTGERKRILPRSGSPKESWYPKKEN